MQLEPATTSSVPQAPTRQSRRALASGAFGATLEYFDFALYGAMSATVFPVVFFERSDPSVALLASFATFGVGVLARPLGGVVFGYLGDRLGRRNVLLATFLVMGLATTAIGLIPGYAAVGVVAPVLLVAMRFLQGFALGGEATGVQLMTMEHAPPDRRAFYGAVLGMGSPISQVAANSILAVLAATLSEPEFLSWGWRIPFLLSVALVAVGVYVRLRVEETPLFREQVADGALPGPLSVVRLHGVAILRLVLGFAPITLTFYLVTVFGISHITANGFTTGATFTMLTVANVLATGAAFWGGRLADRIGRRTVLLIGSGVTLVSAVTFFPAVATGDFTAVLLAVVVASCGAQFGNAAQAALFAEAFPTHLRYTGSALGLTGVNVVFAAPTPFLCAWLVGLGGVAAVAAWWAGVIVLAMVTVALMPDGRSLEGLPLAFGRRRTGVSG
ncbi:MFS transporter [Pseudonocardia broussonetiae]|uniref:MFS transporter n=1 Tax=Pseudonocardia broussonetiae TaxID=2736640 RepID=A0A6M6J9J6_9PSEU|nr:MFS transporter [Pseudonocardia broussonetiae]QJY44514.1 MFS transporter [Pseudonocardia broussonetiae]